MLMGDVRRNRWIVIYIPVCLVIMVGIEGLDGGTVLQNDKLRLGVVTESNPVRAKTTLPALLSLGFHVFHDLYIEASDMGKARCRRKRLSSIAPSAQISSISPSLYTRH